MTEPTLYREATDECVQGYGHSMMDSKCVGCGARNIFVVPVEPARVAIDRYGHVRHWDGPGGQWEGFYLMVRIGDSDAHT